MKASVRVASIAFAAAIAASPSFAETVYRCGSSYSHQPCEGGTAVDVGVSPDAAQRAEARGVATRERQLAAELVHDRQERERASRPATAGSLSAAPAAAHPAAASAPKRKHAHASSKQRSDVDDGRDFVAAVPKSAKK